MNPIIITVIILTAIGLLVSAILFVVAKKFKVEEDARIDDVEAALPGANCGGCGSAGCRDFATKLVAMDDLGNALCPVGGSETMSKIAAILGKTVAAQAPKVAVVKCNGTCANRPKTTNYEGYPSCKVKAALYSGDTACAYGCLGCGDCTRVCKFGAIAMDPETGLPVVDESKCTGCGACSKACPKGIIELRPKGPRGLKVVVLCSSKDKGAVARKACSAACIGCGKCAKVCTHEAITVENNLAYIDADKCRLCTKCVDECPTGAIHKFNFPVKKAAPAAPAAGAAAAKSAAAVSPAPAAAKSAETPKPAPVKPEAPKAEAPAKPAEAPKPAEKPAETPKAETPKAEAPKAEAPAKPAEAPKPAEKPAEAPKAETPKAEAPKAEAPAKPAEAPKPAEKPAEAPKAEAPKAETPAETPKAEPAEAPKAEEPAAKPAKRTAKKAAEDEAEAGNLSEPAAAPAKRRAPRKKPAKSAEPADDRDDVIELDLFSGGVS